MLCFKVLHLRQGIDFISSRSPMEKSLLIPLISDASCIRRHVSTYTYFCFWVVDLITLAYFYTPVPRLCYLNFHSFNKISYISGKLPPTCSSSEVSQLFQSIFFRKNLHFCSCCLNFSYIFCIFCYFSTGTLLATFSQYLLLDLERDWTFLNSIFLNYEFLELFIQTVTLFANNDCFTALARTAHTVSNRRCGMGYPFLVPVLKDFQNAKIMFVTDFFSYDLDSVNSLLSLLNSF